MRWENPTIQNIWSGADDVTDDLKRIFFKTRSLDGAPQIM